MLERHAILVFVAVLLAALTLVGGCKEKRASTSSSAAMPTVSPGDAPPASGSSKEQEERYWKPRGSGSIQLAWKQQTMLHQMFLKKYDAADEEGKKGLQAELEKVFFRTNGVLVQLFESGIQEDPKDAANYVSYGLYLLPRKGQFENAISLIEKATTLERDNAGHHFLLADAYVAPLRSGEFLASGDTRAIRYARYTDKYEVELQRARKLMPDNAFFDYYDALTTYGFEGDLDAAWKLILQGNAKPKSYFILPPPLPMMADSWLTVFEYPNSLHLYWNSAYYPADDFTKLTVNLLTSDAIKNQPGQIFEVARFVFHASHTRPFDRLYHFLLGMSIEQAINYYQDLGSEKKVEELKEVRNFYDQVTVTMADAFLQDVLGNEPGVREPQDRLDLEVQLRRQAKTLIPIYPLELRLMKKFRRALDLDPEQYPVFNDLWQPE